MKTLQRMTALSSSVIAVALFSTVSPVSAATDTWTGSTDTNWSSPGNWTGGNAPPQAGDSLIFNSTPGSTALNNNLTAGTAINGITFGSLPFTLNGNSILLSGSATSNTIGVLNSSGQLQTFGTMPLVLDRGYYTFSSSSGSLALNGGLTLSTGGVAYFDTHNTSSSLTLDATTGLIAGLEGNGLMYDANLTPTGLATISGGNITAYTGFTSQAGASTLATAVAISSGNNLYLSSTGSSAFYSNNNQTVNSITVAQVGNAGGTVTTTLTNVGTLTLGQNGGIYVLGNTIGNKSAFNLALGTLTAGTSGPATITFAVNGNNANNEASCSATIVNNTGGGPVSVIYTGPGSMNFATTTTSSYTGGLYVNEGQLQFGQVAQIGTGPVYVATNASLYFTGTGTITNNFTLASGAGSSTAAAVASGGALEFSGSGTQTLNGTITLNGAPVSQGSPGARISGNLSAAQSAVFAGQITGTGTLDFYVNPHAGDFTLNNQTGNPNNWQGGLILEEVLSGPSSARNCILFLGANGQIPSGSGAGNVTLYSADTTALHSIVRLDMVGHNATINGLIASMPPNNFPVQVGNITGSTVSTLTLGANGNNNGGPFTYAGTLTDGGTVGKALNLVKIGVGTQTLTSTNSYVGSTTVSNGTLALGSGATFPSSTPVNVASAGTFDVSAFGSFTLGAGQALDCIGTVNGPLAINGTISPFYGTIGTFTNNGNISLNGGSTYVWSMNNATGSAGADPGWSLVNVTGGGTLTINTTSANPIVLKITSLSGDAPGNAANFSPSGTTSWTIAKSTVPISNFTPGAFTLNTSAFANSLGSGAFSIGLSGDSKSLILTFTGTPAISTPLVDQTNNAGTTATFTVVANGATPPITFNWLQGSTPLTSPGSSASGGTVTIITNSHTSTLTIANVQDADAGGITVNVSDNFSDTGSSSATLHIIDPPSSPNVMQSQNTPPVSAGAVNILTATANGTQPFTYQWYLGTNLIHGATGSNLNINLSGSTAGTYSVVIGNAAGSVTNNSTVIAPVTVVPNQIIFEPFNYTQQTHNPSPPQPPWSAFGVTNLYNQLTGLDLAWLDVGNNDFTTQPSYNLSDPYTVPPYGSGTRPIVGDEYPVSGLAGNDANAIYADSDVNGGQVNLPFGTGGNSITNGTVYFSFVVQLWGFSPSVDTTPDYLCGLDAGADNSTTHSVGLFILPDEAGGDGAYPNITYQLGVFKGSLTTGQLSPGVNGNWSANQFLDYSINFVVCRLTINPSGGSTCDLWVNPATNSYFASEANVPTPDVAGAGGSAPDTAGGVSSYFMKITTYPVDRLFADLRIGTTWASVTPPSGPTFLLGNVYAPIGTTAVFASQNAGNPVTSSYQWQFDNGSPLHDGATGHGSSISGSGTATLTISNVQPADLGTYTISGSNTSPAPSDNSGTLLGSASALLSSEPPKLSVARSASNVVVEWPTNWLGYVLQTTTNVASTNWSIYSLPPYPVSGTNNAVTVPASGTQYFQLVNP